MKAINIKNLVKTYSNGVQALKGIDLEVEEGDFFGFLGANGAGKTTTIGIMTNLVTKTSGKVEIFGYNIDTDLVKAKLQVGVVPQEFNFNIFEKVIDIVVQQAGFYGMTSTVAIKRAEEILDRLGLGDKKQEISRNLSGGMKRRLMIARALIHNPRLLILDEPTAGVDAELRQGMWEYLQDLNKSGTTILLTTHYLEEVEQLCKNAAIIKKGEIIRNDTVKNLLNSLDEEVFIVDVNGLKTENDLAKLNRKIEIIDENTIEIVLKKEETLNVIFEELDKEGVAINSIRPKGNRLESLFLNILKN